MKVIIVNKTNVQQWEENPFPLIFFVKLKQSSYCQHVHLHKKKYNMLSLPIIKTKH